MHKYLRAVGFGGCTRKQEEKELLERIVREFTTCKSVESSGGEEITELNMVLAPGIGVRVRGHFQENGDFQQEYYYPYLLGEDVSTTAPCHIERHADKEAYSGLCEEYRLGISLIFFLQNSMEYEERLQDPFRSRNTEGVRLSALSVAGKILIPLEKTQEQIELAKVTAEKRTALIEAARQGDQKAVESLTLEDINIYTNVSRRMANEDVYSILDSFFMPFGVECDQYSMLGTILDVRTCKNSWTEETVYVLKVECNDLLFNVAVNERDLMGVPAVGRRFKGDIWLQGALEYQED